MLILILVLVLAFILTWTWTCNFTCTCTCTLSLTLVLLSLVYVYGVALRAALRAAIGVADFSFFVFSFLPIRSVLGTYSRTEGCSRRRVLSTELAKKKQLACEFMQKQKSFWWVRIDLSIDISPFNASSPSMNEESIINFLSAEKIIDTTIFSCFQINAIKNQS